MNMKQALDRLNAIKEAKDQANTLSTLLSRHNGQASKGVTVQVYGARGNTSGRYCVIDADLLQAAIEKTAERHAAEAAKLQPIIDMAELALKGIQATGDTK